MILDDEKSTLTFEEYRSVDLIHSAVGQIEPQSEMRELLLTTGQVANLPPILADDECAVAQLQFADGQSRPRPVR